MNLAQHLHHSNTRPQWERARCSHDKGRCVEWNSAQSKVGTHLHSSTKVVGTWRLRKHASFEWQFLTDIVILAGSTYTGTGQCSDQWNVPLPIDSALLLLKAGFSFGNQWPGQYRRVLFHLKWKQPCLGKVLGTRSQCPFLVASGQPPRSISQQTR